MVIVCPKLKVYRYLCDEWDETFHHPYALHSHPCMSEEEAKKKGYTYDGKR